MPRFSASRTRLHLIPCRKFSTSRQHSLQLPLGDSLRSTHYTRTRRRRRHRLSWRVRARHRMHSSTGLPPWHISSRGIRVGRRQPPRSSAHPPLQPSWLAVLAKHTHPHLHRLHPLLPKVRARRLTRSCSQLSRAPLLHPVLRRYRRLPTRRLRRRLSSHGFPVGQRSPFHPHSQRSSALRTRLHRRMPRRKFSSSLPFRLRSVRFRATRVVPRMSPRRNFNSSRYNNLQLPQPPGDNLR